jgi:hypothetical protein
LTGNRREWDGLAGRKISSIRSSRRGSPREAASTIRTASREQLHMVQSGAKYPFSSPPAKLYQGNKRCGPFWHEVIRSFTT